MKADTGPAAGPAIITSWAQPKLTREFTGYGLRQATLDMFEAIGRTTPVTQDEMDDCYQGGSR